MGFFYKFPPHPSATPSEMVTQKKQLRNLYKSLEFIYSR